MKLTWGEHRYLQHKIAQIAVMIIERFASMKSSSSYDDRNRTVVETCDMMVRGYQERVKRLDDKLVGEGCGRSNNRYQPSENLGNYAQTLGSDWKW